MKICFVTEYYFPFIGGVQTLFENLIERLVKRGHECFVVTSRLPGTKKNEVINGVNVYRVNVPKLLDRYWFTILALPAVYKTAKKCDILHTTTYNAAFPTILAAKLLRKPAIITVHEVLLDLWKILYGLNWFNARVHALIEKSVINLPFDRYICISYYTRNYVRLYGIEDKKLQVIYPGVDYNLFSCRENAGRLIREMLGIRDNFVYLSFGRPGYMKGIEFLVQAVPLISKKIPNSKLLLILSKEPKYKYKQILSIINNLKIKDSVILLESMDINELIKYISCCDCAVIPSLSEGFGFTCVEACAIGMPVVATDVGSIPEIISGNYVFVTPRSPEDICRGVESVYSGKTAFQPKKIFSWEECVDKHEKIYKDLLKG